MKTIIQITLILLLVSCRTTKESSHKTEILKTTQKGVVQVEKEKETHFVKELVYVPSSSNFIIENPCDSLGNLKQVNLQTRIGNLNTSIKTINGALEISINEVDSLKSVIELKERQLQKLDSINQANTNQTITENSTKKTKSVWTKWTYIFLLAFLCSTFLLLSKFRTFIPTFF